MTHASNHRLRRAAIGAVLLASFAFSGAGQALEIVQSKPVAASSTGDSRFVDPLRVDTSFDGFNVSGGTLTAVLLSWNLTLDLAVSASNCSVFGDCNTQAKPSIIDWNLAGSGAAGDALDSVSFATAEWDYNITNDTDSEQKDATRLSLIGSKALANLGDFVGPGPIGAVRNASATRAGYVFYDGRVLDGTLTLTYTYRQAAQAPVPGTLALLGLGLVSAGAWRRRKAG
jgi:hypothetical protein